jgi:hypothetical protein
MEKSDNRYLQTYLKTKVKEQKLLINVIRNELQEERFKNLRLRLDLQVLTENPESKAADKIRHRYNIKRAVLVNSLEFIN